MCPTISVSVTLLSYKRVKTCKLVQALVPDFQNHLEHFLRVNVLDTSTKGILKISLIKERLHSRIEGLIVGVGVVRIDLLNLGQCLVIQEFVVLLDILKDIKLVHFLVVVMLD